MGEAQQKDSAEGSTAAAGSGRACFLFLIVSKGDRPRQDRGAASTHFSCALLPR